MFDREDATMTDLCGAEMVLWLIWDNMASDVLLC